MKKYLTPTTVYLVLASTRIAFFLCHSERSELYRLFFLQRIVTILMNIMTYIIPYGEQYIDGAHYPIW